MFFRLDYFICLILIADKFKINNCLFQSRGPASLAGLFLLLKLLNGYFYENFYIEIFIESTAN